MPKNFTGKIVREDEVRWRIPKSSDPMMRVDGMIYSNDALIGEVLSGGGPSQVANVASLPGIVGASLAMPDIHWGYGFCIGGVAATDISAGGVISPGGVGYDINCGVRLLSSDILANDVRGEIKSLTKGLFRDIPLGVGVGGPFKFTAGELKKILRDGCKRLMELDLASDDDLRMTESGGCLAGADVAAVSDVAIKRGKNQCGTMGAGNHFAEIQVVEEIFDPAAAAAMNLKKGYLTVMIHSGSRGLGHQVCGDYLKILRGAPGKYGIDLPDRQLVCAPVESAEGERYLCAMRAAANFAWANRQLLAMQVRKSFEKFFGTSADSLALDMVYDVAHNIAKIETHEIDNQPRKLCVHRKGATRAFGPGHAELPEKYRTLGQPVIIPGDMGTASYVLLGTETAMAQTFGSTCHGAGRVMSRTQAIKHAEGRKIYQELEKMGVIAIAGSRKGLAEEQPDAYKNVDEVVNCVTTAGISKKVARLKPLGVIKG